MNLASLFQNASDGAHFEGLLEKQALETLQRCLLLTGRDVGASSYDAPLKKAGLDKSLLMGIARGAMGDEFAYAPLALWGFEIYIQSTSFDCGYHRENEFIVLFALFDRVPIWFFTVIDVYSWDLKDADDWRELSEVVKAAFYKNPHEKVVISLRGNYETLKHTVEYTKLDSVFFERLKECEEAK